MEMEYGSSSYYGEGIFHFIRFSHFIFPFSSFSLFYKIMIHKVLYDFNTLYMKIQTYIRLRYISKRIMQ